MVIKRDRTKGLDLTNSFKKIDVELNDTRQEGAKITRSYLFNYLVNKIRSVNPRFYLSPTDVVQRKSLKRLLEEREFTPEDVKNIVDFIFTMKPHYIAFSKFNGFSSILYFANRLITDTELWLEGNYTPTLDVPKVKDNIKTREFDSSNKSVKKGVIIGGDW